MSSSLRFPRTLYRRDDDNGFFKFKNDGIRYDSLLVNDEEELEAGEEIGYIDSYHDAIFGITESVEKTETWSEARARVKAEKAAAKTDENEADGPEVAPETDDKDF